MPLSPPPPHPRPFLTDSEKVGVGVQPAAASSEKWSRLLPLALSTGFPRVTVTRTHTVHPDILRSSDLKTLSLPSLILFSLTPCSTLLKEPLQELKIAFLTSALVV